MSVYREIRVENTKILNLCSMLQFLKNIFDKLHYNIISMHNYNDIIIQTKGNNIVASYT